MKPKQFTDVAVSAVILAADMEQVYASTPNQEIAADADAAARQYWLVSDELLTKAIKAVSQQKVASR